MKDPKDFASLVDALPPISLDEVFDTADLQTRVDRKYVVSVDQLGSVDVGADLAALEIEGRRHFRYETVYFDTPNRQLYLDTARRRPRRFKVRTRTYVDTATSMLEVKAKDGRGRTAKHRLELATGSDRFALDEGMRAFVAVSVATDVVDQLDETATTRFERTTLVDQENRARYTFDQGLTSTGTDGRVVGLDGSVIIECKSPGRATALDRALWAHGIRPAKISKYCTTLAVLEPELPSNRWHRTLQRHPLTLR